MFKELLFIVMFYFMSLCAIGRSRGHLWGAPPKGPNYFHFTSFCAPPRYGRLVPPLGNPGSSTVCLSIYLSSQVCVRVLSLCFEFEFEFEFECESEFEFEFEFIIMFDNLMETTSDQ